MKYLILSKNDRDRAWSLSAAIMAVGSPASVQDAEGRETKYYSTPVQHNGQVALPILNGGQYVHPDPDTAPLVTFLDAVLSANERDQLLAEVDAARGGEIDFLAAVENTALSANLFTRAELEAGGWFADEKI